MNLNPDSPELTAYALGALPEAEMRRISEVVAADPVLTAEVEEIRRCSRVLAEALGAEASLELTEAQREAIRAGVPAPDGAESTGIPDGSGRGPGWWWRWILMPACGAGLAGAAALVLALVFWPRPPGGSEAVDDGLRYGPMPQAPSVAAGPVDAPAVLPPVARPTRMSDSSPASAPESVPEIRTKTSGGGRREAPSQTRGGAGAPAPANNATVVAGGTERSDRLRGDTSLTAADPAGASQPEGVGSPHGMEPALMRRYGLRSREGAEVGAAPPGVGAGGQVEPRDQMEVLRSTVRPLPGIAFGGGEAYAAVVENPFRQVNEARLSTFGIDVDTASYANIRRFLREGAWPPPDAVRLEEMINYFRYTRLKPAAGKPVTAQVDATECPWKPGNRLVRISVGARGMPEGERPMANLVFLVDVSGSMQPENKLPLVQRSLRMLADRLRASDRVSIVTYAGAARVVLEPTLGSDKARLHGAIDGLRADGSTHGSAGIRLAYGLARTNLVEGGVNRVILCTDGDFNVGMTSRDSLLQLIEEEARTGVFLTVLGYGMGNYKDATMELLADRGNGAYAYIDSFREAQKVLTEELESTLVTVAKDVKLQVEFNPARVASWRLLGYENRVLANREFNDDRKDAGDMGAGQTVTALYEVVPVEGQEPGVDPLRYAARPAVAEAAPMHPDEFVFVKLRYKLPDEDRSVLLEYPVKADPVPWDRADGDFRFASAVAGFGMLLKDSPHRGNLTYESVLGLAERAIGDDREGYRSEFVDLVRRARQLRGGR